MNEMMKAAVVHHPGAPNVLKVQEVPIPKVRPGWSLVRIRGFGVNHSEIFTRQGLSPGVAFPRILGIECVGTVAESSDTTHLPVGRRVVSIMGEMGRAFDGSYAEYCLLPNAQIIPVVSDLPWPTLAAIPETFYTAFGSLQNLHLTGDEHVLVRGATSGVGIAFAGLVHAAYPKMSLAGSCRRPEAKRDALAAAGFDTVIADCGGALQTNRTFDRVLELIGPASLKDTCAHTMPGGIICSTGQLGGQWFMDGFDPIMDLPEGGYLTSFYSGNVRADRMNALLAFIETHDIDAAPVKVFDLDHVSDAHRYLEGRHSFGKTVVLP